MADPAYGLGFPFGTITNVHFGSNYVGIAAGVNPSNIDYRPNIGFVFPQLAGGTPGFSLVDHGFIDPSLPRFGTPVTAAQLKQQLHTGGGLGVIGFAQAQPELPIGVFPGGAIQYALLMTRELGSPFIVQFNFDGFMPSANWNYTVSVGTIKPGVDQSNIFDFKTKSGSGSAPPAAVSFRVDPGKKKVTLLN